MQMTVYADDSAINTSAADEMQHSLDRLSSALTILVSPSVQPRLEVMYKPAPGREYPGTPFQHLL